jgi:hypothetical protein
MVDVVVKCILNVSTILNAATRDSKGSEKL